MEHGTNILIDTIAECFIEAMVYWADIGAVPSSNQFPAPTQ